MTDRGLSVARLERLILGALRRVEHAEEGLRDVLRELPMSPGTVTPKPRPVSKSRPRANMKAVSGDEGP